MSSYVENEIKILDVEVDLLVKKLDELGAKKVFDGLRKITTFDYADGFLRKSDKILRVTEEDKIKLSINVAAEKTRVVKVFTSRFPETKDLLHELGIDQVAQVKARRISFELGKVDFDIDVFPHIPPFLEIDLEHVSDVDSLLESLDLSNHKRVGVGTEEVFSLYELDYFEIFKL